MLHRLKRPNQGLWNGVGGHIEPGETPSDSCLREVEEETGYTLLRVKFAGLLTWDGFEIADGGLYLFTAEAPPGEPRASHEGDLAWKTKKWVFSSPKVVENIHYVAPAVLNGSPPRQYHFNYQNSAIFKFAVHPLPDWVDVLRPFADG